MDQLEKAAFLAQLFGKDYPDWIPILTDFRADGWPLCPQCGEDELYSLLFWDGSGERPPIREWMKAGLQCYRCGWSSKKQEF